MAYEVMWEPPRGACRKYTGHITDEELIESIALLYGDPRFDDLRYIVNDFLDVDSFSITEDTVMYISAISGAAARSNPAIKVAIVVGETQGTSLPLRYATSPLTVYPTCIFQDMAEARAWIASDQPASKP